VRAILTKEMTLIPKWISWYLHFYVSYLFEAFVESTIGNFVVVITIYIAFNFIRSGYFINAKVSEASRHWP
jgi:hypothetical protein